MYRSFPVMSSCVDPSSNIVKNAPFLSVACNPETNTIVAGTELVSSQAFVTFW